MADLQQVVTDAVQAFRQQPLAKQLTTVGIFVAGLVVFGGLLMYANRQSYAPLMTNLTPEDAAQIIDKLQSSHVPYRLEQGGSAVLVPEDQVHEQRLKLAGAGLPRGGNVGFELFDTPNFGMSHFSEQLNYHRALEGELRRTIRQIDAVRDARVHIVMPERSLFKEQEQRATAAITLQLHPGRQLSSNQVQAIVHLVAASVQGLNPDQVTVVDSSGGILAKGGESGGGGGLNSALERQRSVEHSIEDRVQQILIPVVGEGHVVVRATASLDFSRSDRTTESYDPRAQVVRSEQFSEENRGPNTAPSGIPGSRSNLTGVGAAAKPGQAAAGSRRLETRNYEIGKVVQHEIGQEGKLARLSVAVLLDGVQGVGEDGKPKMQERPAEEIARITELVRRAVGFDADRDDQVLVQSMPFEMAPPPAATPVEVPGWLSVALRLWPALLATVATVFVVMAMASRRKRGGLPTPVLEMPRSVRDLENEMQRGGGVIKGRGGAGQLAAGGGVAGLPAAAGGAAALGAGQAAATGAPPAPGAPPQALRPEPGRAANVLKTWLNE